MDEKVRRLLILSLILLSLILIVVSPVAADCQIDCLGCRHTIKVIPVDSTKTGEPIITENPADLMIFQTGNGPIKNVWLLIVLNEPTYNALNQILINDTVFMTKDDFKLVTTKKIPQVTPDPSINYPGSLCQYEVAAIKDKIKEKGNPIYYGIKFFLVQITKKPTQFTLTVELNSPANLKGLILALGRYNSACRGQYEIDCFPYKPFNACNSFSNSTLVVPEIATLALTAAPFGGAIGFYAMKRRKKQK
ncbi:MAG: hypothetical protein ACUVUF_00720 [Candidatus Bathycorpusculaceae bacterium]